MAAKVISFINLKGGVGKSTLTMIIAEYMAFKYDKKVLTIDFDSQANLSAAMVRQLYIQDYLQKDKRTIYHLIAAFLNEEDRSISDFICPNPEWVSNILRRPGVKLDIVISTPELARLDEDILNMWERGEAPPKDLRFVLKRALEPVLNEYDIILIDCPPGLSLLTSAAIAASDYFVSPIIPEPLSYLGIDLIQNRIAELKKRYPDIKIEHAGSILNKVLHWRTGHREETSRIYGVPTGRLEAFPVGRYRPFKYWIPDADHLRKLGDFECHLLSENYPYLDTTRHFGWVHGKYGGSIVRPRNPTGGHPLDRSTEEGREYNLSGRLERLTREFMERVGIS